MVYSEQNVLFILEHYVLPKSFAAVRDTFTNACSDKEMLNKTTPGNKISGHRKCL